MLIIINGTSQETINGIRKDLAQGPLGSLPFQIIWESYPGIDESGESIMIVRIKCDPEEAKKIESKTIDLPKIAYVIRKNLKSNKTAIVLETMRYI